MSVSEQQVSRRLRRIVIVQGIAGAIAFAPLLLLAGVAFGKSALMKPENLVLAIWSATGVAAATFNVLGGVVLYHKPRRRVILGSLAVSAVLLTVFVLGLI